MTDHVVGGEQTGIWVSTNHISQQATVGECKEELGDGLTTLAKESL